MTAKRKIGLFGGTFDPVHLGHIHLAGIARDALGLDEVHFLPCRISPHKSGTTPASGHDRCEMLRLAIANLPWAVTDDMELTRSGPSFSYITAEAMAEKFPDALLFWIMGGDQWDALTLWKDPLRLAACVEFIVLARGETPEPLDGFRLHVVQGQHPASSTTVRESIAYGNATPPWLDPDVAKYIEENGIYRSDTVRPPDRDLR